MSQSECKECGSTGWVTAQDGDGVSMKRCRCAQSDDSDSIRPRGFHFTVGVDDAPGKPGSGWKKPLMWEQGGQVFIASLSPEQIRDIFNASGGLQSWQHFAHVFEIHFINLIAQEMGLMGQKMNIMKQQIENLGKSVAIAEERQVITEKRLADNDDFRKAAHAAVDALGNRISTLDGAFMRLTSSVLDLSNGVIKFLTGGVK